MRDLPRLRSLLERDKGAAIVAGGMEGSRTQAQAEAASFPSRRQGSWLWWGGGALSVLFAWVVTCFTTFTDADAREIVPQWIMHALRALAEADTSLLIKN